MFDSWFSLLHFFEKKSKLNTNVKGIYEEEFERAMGEDRDRSSFTVTPEYQLFKE